VQAGGGARHQPQTLQPALKAVTSQSTRMRFLGLLVVLVTVSMLAALAAPAGRLSSGLTGESAAAHNNGWAFPASAIRKRKNALRFTLNRLFPDWGPHQIRCWGLGPVSLRNGSLGYVHIRCRAESMPIPDFLYHLSAGGRLVTTRVR
jgi:hypothetical protein